MVRNMDKFKKSLELHHKWQADHFNSIRNGLLLRAKYWQEQGDNAKASVLVNQAEKMRFQFDKSKATINFGDCSKYDKPVSFIPNTLQLHTQACFESRR
jgi:hypothetical protein